MNPRYYHQVVGVNSRMDGFQAAVLRIKLRHLAEWQQQRAKVAATYFQLFQESGLDGIIGLPKVASEAGHVWNQFVIRVPEGRRDALRNYLSSIGIGTEIYYPVGLHEQKCFASLGYQPEDLPETFRATREVLALPCFPELLPSEQELVVEGIARFYKRGGRHHEVPQPAAGRGLESAIRQAKTKPAPSTKLRR